MSIKSQKSLNDECSEIFEKSYSVRSLSEESLATDEEEESLSRELLNKMTPAVLSRLRRRFKRTKDRSSAKDIHRKVEEAMHVAAAAEGVEFPKSSPSCIDTSLHWEGFVSAIDDIFGHHKFRAHARQLCQALDPLGSGRVRWGELLSRLQPAPRAPPLSMPPVTTPPQKLRHCKRECIMKLVSIEREDSFCYVAVSRGGRVGVYSGHLKLLSTYQVFHNRPGANRRIKNCWITDAVYMNAAQCVTYATSERCLRVFSAHTLTHAPQLCVTALPDIPTCLAYSEPAVGGRLAVGTARGALYELVLRAPLPADSPPYCTWHELCTGAHAWCSARSRGVLHSRAVRRLAYERDVRRILSCSHDPQRSLCVRHSSLHMNDVVASVQRGVSCFHWVTELKLVVTGSCDGAVRLWDVAQPTPYACLSAPSAMPVLDVAVVPYLHIAVAYHNNCTVNIWDLQEECLLHSIKIKFPFLGVLGKKVEFGTYCIHPGPPRKNETTEELQEETTSPSRPGSSLSGDDGRDHGNVENDPECSGFKSGEVLITCCEYVCRVALEEVRGSVPPAPRDAQRARRPACWAPALLADHSCSRDRQHPPASPGEPDALARHDLQGIMEKDFVEMRGIKNDLNRKMYQTKANMDAGMWAVRSGAPHLALAPRSPPRVAPPAGVRRRDTYQRLLRLLPPPSISGTPTSSRSSTPSRTRSTKL